MKKLLFIPLVAFVVFLSSCSEDGETSTDLVETFDLETEETAEANFEDVDDIVDSTVETQISGARVDESEVLDGAVITHDTENNTITIDYGDGVEGPGGRLRSGMIIITYSELRWLPGAFREVTFQDFYVDSVQVEGVRRLENTSASTDEAPQFTVSLTGGRLTFADGTTITREVNKVRTWNRANNPVNDTVIVTGTATGSRRDGRTYTVEILEEIMYKRGCRVGRVFIPVSGTKLITAGDNTALVDYGDGDCDNIATISVNDGEAEEFNIVLRSGRRL